MIHFKKHSKNAKKCSKMQKKTIFQYKVYIETFSGILLYIGFHDSQKRSDTKLLKIHLEM